MCRVEQLQAWEGSTGLRAGQRTAPTGKSLEDRLHGVGQALSLLAASPAVCAIGAGQLLCSAGAAGTCGAPGSAGDAIAALLPSLEQHCSLPRYLVRCCFTAACCFCRFELSLGKMRCTALCTESIAQSQAHTTGSAVQCACSVRACQPSQQGPCARPAAGAARAGAQAACARPQMVLAMPPGQWPCCRPRAGAHTQRARQAACMYSRCQRAHAHVATAVQMRRGRKHACWWCARREPRALNSSAHGPVQARQCPGGIKRNQCVQVKIAGAELASHLALYTQSYTHTPALVRAPPHFAL